MLPCAAEAMALARRREDLAPARRGGRAAASDNLVWLCAAVGRGARGHRRRPALGPHHGPRARLPRTVSADAGPRGAAVLRAPARAEIVALAEEGLRHGAAHRRPGCSGGPAHTAWKALWTPTHLEPPPRRSLGRDWRRPAPRATRTPRPSPTCSWWLQRWRAGDLAAASSSMSGSRSAWRAEERRAPGTDRRRNSYALMALGWVHLSLASMSGDDAAAPPGDGSWSTARG